MRTKYNKKRIRTIILIVVLLLGMSIGFSYINETIDEKGVFYVKGNTWNIHWDNIVISPGSVKDDQVPIEAHILGDTTKVEYSVVLHNPGDYYEFTIDSVNDGSMDAMIAKIDTKIYEIDGKTEKELPNYLEYEFIYNDGTTIKKNQLLKSKNKETIKVRIKYKEDISKDDLPTTDETIVVKQEIGYVQADENAIEK